MIAKVVFAALLSCDPSLAALFTPAHPQLGTYTACTTAMSITEMVTGVAGVAGVPGIVHFGKIEALEALDAFGRAGRYDRAALARLYGGTRVKVARGWAQDGGRVQSITLLSPYPDPALQQLNSGTLVIVFSTQP